MLVRGTVVSIFEHNCINAFSEIIGELTTINVQNDALSDPFLVGDLINFVNV